MAQTVKRGVVLMNLGSPDSTSVGDVRRYLNEFLMDKRVIDIPYLSRLLLVRGIIVPFRAPKSAVAYRSIWTPEGSPLIVITRQLAQALEKQAGLPVEMAMRYGNPSVKTAFDSLVKRVEGLEEVIAIPMYPHYAMSSYETAVEDARETHRKQQYGFSLRFIEPFYNDPAYLEALAESIRPSLDQEYDHVLFSYHGVPERHLVRTDPTGCHCLKNEDCCNTDSIAHKTCYRHQCYVTTKRVVDILGIQENKYSVSFQSRLGRDPWLKPYTDHRLRDMPAEGIKKLLVLCPAFVSDCLETLEEIAEQGRETFLHAGGESYQMIPCLNVHPKWVEALEGWVG